LWSFVVVASAAVVVETIAGGIGFCWRWLVGGVKVVGDEWWMMFEKVH